jgi:hypothetical protein
MHRFSHRYKMVSAKDDSLPTNVEVSEADADQAVAARGRDAEVGTTQSKILAIFDRKTYELAFLSFQLSSILKHLATMARCSSI